MDLAIALLLIVTLIAWRLGGSSRKASREDDAEVHYTLLYRWIQTLEAQLSIILVLITVMAGILSSNPVYIFVDGGKFDGTDVIGWNMLFVLVGVIYNYIQYESPAGAFPREISVILWTVLGARTLMVLSCAHEVYGSAIIFADALVGLGALLLAGMWCICDTPAATVKEDHHRAENLGGDFQSPLLSETPEAEGSAPRQAYLHEGGMFSQWLFEFATPYFKKDHKTVDDLPPLKAEELVTVQSKKFKELYNSGTKGTTLGTAVRLYVGDNVLRVCFGYFIGAHFQLFNPLVIGCFFDSLQEYVRTKSLFACAAALSWALVLLLCMAAEVISRNRMNHQGWRYGIWLDGVLSVAVYEKILKVATGEMRKAVDTDNGSVDQVSKGALINMLSLDVDRVNIGTSLFPDLVLCPYKLIILFYMLYRQTGLCAVICTLAWVAIFSPLTTYFYKKELAASTASQEATDFRLQAESEFLQAVKALKLYGWVGPFVDKIKQRRNSELHQQVVYKLYQVVSIVNWFNITSVVIIAVFGSRFLFTSDPIDPKVVISSLLIIGPMAFPLSTIALLLQNVIDGYTSLQRVQKYLKLPECPSTPSKSPIGLDPRDYTHISIQLKAADVTWNGSDTAILRDVNFTVNKGDFVAIIGRIGEGKTCLLETLIGESDLMKGELYVNGSVAYAAQGAWIQSASVRENILCGLPYEQDWYDRVVAACCLVPDFDQLHQGDATPVGEEGIAVSGGQKQRLALARAVYARRDIVVLDDVLSAVDFMVAQHIVAHVFNDLLRSVTVVMATHRTALLTQASQILILDSGGCHVFSSKAEAFESPLLRELRLLEADFATRDGEVSRTTKTPLKTSASKAMLKQDLNGDGDGDGDKSICVGAASRWVNMKTYIESCGGLKVFVGLVILCAAYSLTGSLAGLYLSYYADHSVPRPDERYISAKEGSLVVTSMEVMSIAMMASFLVAVAYYGRRGGKQVHSNLLDRLQNARMVFFEKTPSGNVLSRLSKDMAVVDSALPQTLTSVIDEMCRVGANSVTIAVASPVSAVFLIPLFWIMKETEKYYTRAYATVIRLQTALKSPVYTHVAETLSGLTTIRAFGYQDMFREKFMMLLTDRIRAGHAFLLGNRWIGSRLELANGVFGFCVAVVAVFMATENRLTYLVFAVGCAVKILISVSWLVRQIAAHDGNLVSVSRVTAYNDDELCPQEPEVTMPLDGRFRSASVEFRGVSMRYGPDLPLVLKEVSFKILAGTKVGIIGRTGAGKTSIMSCLLRLIDIECGDIYVDGRSIFSMSIGHLRKEFAVIPQDPVLFSGTLRFNLDPLGHYTHLQVEEAVRHAHLSNFVASLPARLDTMIDSSGSNMSFGQRQLVCLARVLLKDSKILLMDEATSSVDPVTDQLIQQCIKDRFRNRTILTIAHRIQTILDYDLVMGLSDGRVVELGPPSQLISDPGSLLYTMLRLDSSASTTSSA
eukprot:Blabericola_migrator_1__455@NODE_110_length_13983_cov_82_900618_g98_i0_p1_GENE_NODE_110_length_13983_cov_82_900618_g98_i0NODE_110_length_13983_cov_82_900618_g98_i0_p1_ORF_typecomplete_len1462_score259_28ABC_tran/PF00005_27/2_7e21ABC_tran/PF00005_27/9_3e33ABC_membrane/PF00664_23/1_4e03ABC_membrane/PF00664_23/2_9e19ABC_membrane/PF00664_23/2_2e29AAA_21/PF13304_6/1_1AAA_21/PF13304_6/0_034ABC_ATPase/PF09818_9/7_7ABC_ATPase/PF09818_9/0_029MMR_HSR1/PF01926_23/22MMR_HSR1/PF01926_23/0_12AAA_22/PF13401_6/